MCVCACVCASARVCLCSMRFVRAYVLYAFVHVCMRACNIYVCDLHARVCVCVCVIDVCVGVGGGEERYVCV